ncbi:FUSC family protein [Nocardia cyriacigeorgica]|uniref:FUSC family protein n=1 Tax=Nocardia cyriacigeorgica TaxID=135487 RepID=UPI001893C710|nr:FUSC family protein [Nocardia cyriacigeorgica]MBF6086527.1 FUSC family protein [Nocardia cyriacigeorgica]MBF6091160.1 FUSC family protein [Nocardia cyriacigeorgica]MBF6395216.1 FUSC family protein [Nocardia cyriacigeorgica]MBF6400849.1 FUSC family protein [Nocardia cyriacigeorgica]
MPDPDGPQRSPAESGSPKPLSPAPDGPNLPAPAPARAVLFGVPPAGRRLPGAVRTALAFGAPALIAALLGHEQQGLIAALGSFAVIFGEGRVYRQRWRAIGWAGLGLIAAACAGGFTGAAIHRHTAAGSGHAWLLVLVVLLAAVAVRGTYRGIHRVGGTVLGLAVFTVIYAFEPRGFALVLVLMGLQFSIELFVARNYGLAVVFITPLALLMGGGGVYGDPLPVAFDRFLESVIGVLIGLGVLWLVDRHSHRRVLLRNDRRVIASLDRLLDALRTDPGRVPETRKELEFELMGSTLAEIDAAHNEPAWARTQWPRHERIRQLGHRVLAATWNLGPDRPADPVQLARWTDSVAGLR